VSYRRAFSVAAAAGAALALSAPAALAAQPSAAVRIAGTVSPAATLSPRVASVASSSPIDFEVNLRLASGAQAFATAVSTPGNALYGRFLTPGQWEHRFSPTSRDVARVVAFLRNAGFRIAGVSADRTAIDVSGSAARVERAFSTSLSFHKVDGRQVRLADRALAVPASIAGLVLGITGVSQSLAHPDNTVGNAAAGKSVPGNWPQPPGFRVAPPCASYYGQKVDTTFPRYEGYPYPAPWAVCGYTPPQFRSAYSVPGGLDGTGVTVAVVDAYASSTLLSDAQKFASINDPGHPLRESQFSELVPSSFNQGDLCGASGWFGEQSLDVEAVHGMAPGAHVLYAGARNCGEGDLNSVVRAIVDGHLASVVTNSYGDNGGDILDPPSIKSAVDEVAMMAAGTGVSLLFSSGDNGDEYTTLGVVAADYPPSSPWVTAVGGTTLQVGASGQRSGEFGWSTARSYLCNETYIAAGGCTDAQRGRWTPINLALDGGSGGGTSVVYPQPAYQAGVVPSALSQVNGSAPMRVEPDISLEADPATGMLVGETQTFPNGVYYDQYRIGGTSVASPLFAGLVADANQAAGHSLGFLNPQLYALNGNSQALYDVLPAGRQDMSRADFANSISDAQGFLYTTRIIDYEKSEQYCEPSGKCRNRDVALNATPGYDNMTGLGAPGSGFLAALGRR
jgi:subtilase family serine protease